MGIQTKTISEFGKEDFDSKIKEFIESVTGVEIIDIKFHITGSNIMIMYHALIIYKIK